MQDSKGIVTCNDTKDKRMLWNRSGRTFQEAPSCDLAATLPIHTHHTSSSQRHIRFDIDINTAGGIITSSATQPSSRPAGVHNLLVFYADPSPSLLASGIRPRIEVIRDPTTIKTALVIPIRRILRLPGPVDPARSTLVDRDLGFKQTLELRLVSCREIGARASLVRTASNVPAALTVAAIVSSTDAPAVEVLGTVGGGGSPLTDHSPKVLVRRGEAITLATVVLQTLVLGHGNLLRREDRIDVRVKEHLLELRRLSDPVPVAQTHETIVDHNGGIAKHGSDPVVAIVVVLLSVVHHVTAKVASRLVEELDRRDGAIVLGEASSNGLDNIQCAVTVVAAVVGPVGSTSAS